MFFSNQVSRFRFSFKDRALSFPTLFLLAIAGAFIYFLVLRFDINPQEIWTNLKNINPWFLLLAFLLHYSTFLFRGVRWRLLLSNVEGSKTTPSGVAYCGSLIFISWVVNSVTLLRLGDAYRAFLYSNERGRSFPQTLGTVLAERIVDVLIMFSLLVVAALTLLIIGVDTPWLFLALASSLPAAVILGLLIMRFLKTSGLRFLPRPLGQAYLRFHQSALGSFANLPLIVLLGALGWLAEVARLFFVTEALGLSLSVPLIVFATLANAILTLLPLGGLGVAEFGVAELLTRSLTRSAAGSVVVLDRAISYVSVIILGGLFFLVRNAVIRRRPTVGQARSRYLVTEVEAD